MSVRLYFFIIFMTGVVVALLLVIFSFFNPRTTNPPAVPSPTPVRPLVYPTGTIQKQVDKLKNRQPLSPDDAAVRKRILAIVNNQSGVVKETTTYKIKYLKPFDNFEVEILSTEITKVKSESLSWFTSQGLSQQGICNLPVMFFLNYEVMQKLPETKTFFDPLPEGC